METPPAGSAVRERDWREDLARRFYQVKLADAGLQLAKDQSRQTLVNRLVRLAQNRGFGLSPGTDAAEEDELAVHIGDQYQTSHGSRLAAVALAGVLGLGLPGAIAAWKAPEIIGALKPAAGEPQEIETAPDSDTDTVIRLRK